MARFNPRVSLKIFRTDHINSFWAFKPRTPKPTKYATTNKFGPITTALAPIAPPITTAPITTAPPPPTATALASIAPPTTTAPITTAPQPPTTTAIAPVVNQRYCQSQEKYYVSAIL